ncbi:MAG: right-handed parallel beta-helix repeat-containing protein [Candidatus Entotheonellia bacterium]
MFGLLVAVVLLGRQEQSVGVAGADSAVKKVECDKGQTLTEALKQAKPGDTLQVTGTCQERVAITTDRLTLDGGGSAVLDGGGGSPTEFEGVVTIDGAHGVTLTGFTIQNGPGEGILGQRGAAFTVLDTMVQDNAGIGIAVGGSTAELTDCAMRRNLFGLDVFAGASTTLRGAISISHNLGPGAFAGGASILEIRGADVRVNNNSDGIVVLPGGQLMVFAFSSSVGSTLTADGNGVGIFLLGGQFPVFNSSTIKATNNDTGILANNAASIMNASPAGSGEFVLENNRIGLNFESGAGASFQGGPLTIRNNGTGLLADGAGTLTIQSDPSKASSIVDNGTDVDLKFGTRATFDGVTVGTITCDATVLSRGSTVCP